MHLPFVDTGQKYCYDDLQVIRFPKPGEMYYGQDARYSINPPSYTDNGDRTVTDNVTGLIWTQDPGEKDYGHYWSSTTHAGRDGSRAAYVAFGRALGYMRGEWLDVHGAGCQRSDAKTGDEADLPQGRGPQGDVQRINNMVRLVRGGNGTAVGQEPIIEKRIVD